MKTFILLTWSFFLFTILSNDCIGQNAWKMIAPNPPQIITAYSCITIGQKAYFWCPNNIVFSTSDGGKFFNVYPPYAPVADMSLGCCNNQGIAFADSMVGYITDIAHGEFRTTDGGFTWTKTASVGADLEIVLFGNSKIGWKFGDGGTYRTTDAGLNWTFIEAPYGYAGIFSKAFSLDSNRVWLAKSFYNGRTIEGSIWRSTNSGFDWTRLISAPISDSINSVTYNDLRINPSGIGIAIGTIQNNFGTINSFASRTTDFGTSWSTTMFSTENPRTVLSIGDSIWLILGGGSTTYTRRSVDSGKTWIYTSGMFSYQDYNSFGTATYIPEHSTILASTIAGLFRSTDLGLTFSKITDSLDVIITGLSIDIRPINPSQQLVIAKSFDGSFIRSTDAGTTWTKGYFASTTNYSFSQVRIAQGIIYSIPDQSRLYKSTDNGDSWISINIPGFVTGLRALYAFDKNSIVMQSYQNILYSPDGGSSWIHTPFPGNYWLNESSIPARGVIVGGGGYYDSAGMRGIIYRSTNMGYDWQIIDFPHEIIHLKMITATKGFAVSNYEVYKTSDGARTWEKILSSTNYYQHYSDFFFDDSLRGLMRFSFDFMETFTGGKSWQSIELGLPIYTLGHIDHLADGKLIAEGDGMLWELPSFSLLGNTSTIPNSRNKQLVPDAPININPNPFNPWTTISFSLESPSRVQLTVYDILGRKVAELVNEELVTGTHSIPFDGSALSSGVYFFTLQTRSNLSIVKALLLK